MVNNLVVTKVAFINDASPYVHHRLLECFEARRKDGWVVMTPQDSRHSRKKHRKSIPHPELPAAAVLQWDDYENISWPRVLNRDLLCNSYCFRKGLTRKVQLAQNIEIYVSKNPTSLLKQSTPETWILDIATNDYVFIDDDGNEYTQNEDDSDEEYLQEIRIEHALEDVEHLFSKVEAGEAHPVWILKPSLGSKGAEVVIAKDFQTVHETVRRWKDVCEWVLQAYILNPLLVYGRKKFHLRVHVVASGVLQVYVHQDVIALMSTEDYVPDEIDNHFMHITNSCVQREKAVFQEDVSVRLLSELVADKQITAEQETIIFEKIKTNVREVFRAVEHQKHAFFGLKNCFELFGCDFLVDEDINVWLLELNCGPDMKNTGNRLDHVVSSFLDDALSVTVDKYFQKDRFYDAFPPMSASPETATIAKFGRLHMVYNSSEPDWGTPNIKFE